MRKLLRDMFGFKKKLDILVLGSNGMLGHDVVNLLRQKAQDRGSIIGKVVSLDVNDGVDVSKRHALGMHFMDSIHYDYCINCVAYTDTKAAQTTVAGEELDFKLNALAPKHIAESCAFWCTKLIHVSTDYVFSEKSDALMRKFGSHDMLFNEDDEVFPVNTYGKNKLLGEQFIESEFLKKDKERDFCILRTSWLYGAHNNKSFIHKFLKNVVAKAHDNPNVAPVLEMTSNEVSIPTSTQYVAECIHEAIAHGLSGVKHAVCEAPGAYKTGVSRCDFARKILEECKATGEEWIGSSQLIGVERDTYQPLFSAMKSSFAVSKFSGLTARSWDEALHEFMSKNGKSIVEWAKTQV